LQLGTWQENHASNGQPTGGGGLERERAAGNGRRVVRKTLIAAISADCYSPRRR